MKKIIICVILALAALWGAFYTENLTERNRRLAMQQYKPDRLVALMMRDSLPSLRQKAVSIESLSADYRYSAFAEAHSRQLGIGSPDFYIVADSSLAFSLSGQSLSLTIADVPVSIPLHYIFGNTAREATGWFNIDDFRNTTEFNAVSAEMNKAIVRRFASFRLPAKSGATLSFVGAVSVDRHAPRLDSLSVVPLIINIR